MLARIGTWNGTADELESWVEQSRSNVIPGVMQAPGAAGVILLLDRDSSEALTITLWRDGDSLRASEERRTKLQHQTSTATGASVETSRYEVVEAVWPQ
jgi:hypothetical protein